ncbi:MAG: Hpt domain-containing protein [Lachnospiraceae bacterium]|nr:Hpt domain-containing protein [Lachnospiraceae bacterium]
MLLEKLKAWGAEPEEALKRLLGDKEFYEKLLDTFAKELQQDELAAILGREDYPAAFVQAHRMKGSAADLGLIPLYEILSVVTDDLRDQVAPGLPEDVEKLQRVVYGFLEIVG